MIFASAQALEMTRHRAEKRTDTIDDDRLAIFSGESVVIEFNEPQLLTLEANYQ